MKRHKHKDISEDDPNREACLCGASRTVAHLSGLLIRGPWEYSRTGEAVRDPGEDAADRWSEVNR